MFKNKKICIFGGPGTVGSLLTEFFLSLDVDIIRVVSNSEQELWEASQKWHSHKVRYLLGDIRDLDRVIKALRDIDYVFNCAAIKHVPFAEYNPLEAVKTNVLGLDNILNACVTQKVKKMLHISTDKAVEPTCVMGNTKAIGERLVQMRWAQYPQTKMVVVRSGNIWDSRGSILQLVKECQKQEKPIPLTHFDMTRYFIHPQELVEFIIRAFIDGDKGEIWVPKLKEINIAQLIKGKCPKNYPIIEIGRRKGEKLHEKLISEAETNRDEYDTHWIIKNDWRTI